MVTLSLPRIEERLREHRPTLLDSRPFQRQAAVAAILRESEGGPEVLFIKRAQRPGDIWSGHMAFPGGHRDPGDQDLGATAMRETQEEIGLDLSRHARLLGHLDHMDITPIGTQRRMLVVPYVFALEGELPRLQPNYEVAAVLWGSVPGMFHGHTLTRREMHVRGASMPFPGYDVHNELVWGLTYRMLHRFFSVLDPGWHGADD